jgi:hypothetical protein
VLRGIGIVAEVNEIAMACVLRDAARWRFQRAIRCALSSKDSIAARFKRAREAWLEMEIRVKYVSPASWFAIKDPWGLVAGGTRDSAATVEGRRQTLMVGQAIEWAIEEGIEPVLFEPGEIRRGLGAQVDSDGRRLAACAAAMVSDCPEHLSLNEAAAVATAVMGGRHYLGPAALLKGKRL